MNKFLILLGILGLTACSGQKLEVTKRQNLVYLTNVLIVKGLGEELALKRIKIHGEGTCNTAVEGLKLEDGIGYASKDIPAREYPVSSACKYYQGFKKITVETDKGDFDFTFTE